MNCDIEIGYHESGEIKKRHKSLLRNAKNGQDAVELGIVLAKQMFPSKSVFCWINKQYGLK